jgi:hypothetical protein
MGLLSKGAVKAWKAEAKENTEAQAEAAAEFLRVVDMLAEVRGRWRALEVANEALVHRLANEIAPAEGLGPEARTALEAMANVATCLDGMTKLKAGVPDALIKAADHVATTSDHLKRMQRIRRVDHETRLAAARERPKPAEPIHNVRAGVTLKGDYLFSEIETHERAAPHRLGPEVSM